MDTDAYHVRFRELFLTNTDLTDPEVNILARNLTILSANFNHTRRLGFCAPSDLALISCRCTNETKWFLTLVKLSESQVDLIIKGDPMPSRIGAAEGS